MKTQLSLLSLLALLGGSATTTNGQTAAQINATPVETRVAWCQHQTSLCTNLCAWQTLANVCSVSSLAFTCVCKNGTRVDFSDAVDMTIPYFTCITYQWQPCISSCPMTNSTCYDDCNARFVCGRVRGDLNKTSTTAATRPPTGTANTNFAAPTRTAVSALGSDQGGSNAGVENSVSGAIVAIAAAVGAMAGF